MAHPKEKSGDPDYDDKVPMDAQVGEVLEHPVTGERVVLTEAAGPRDQSGTRVNMDAPKADDNRPKPGDVATEASSVQVASSPTGTVAKPKTTASKAK